MKHFKYSSLIGFALSAFSLTAHAEEQPPLRTQPVETFDLNSYERNKFIYDVVTATIENANGASYVPISVTEFENRFLEFLIKRAGLTENQDLISLYNENGASLNFFERLENILNEIDFEVRWDFANESINDVLFGLDPHSYYIPRLPPEETRSNDDGNVILVQQDPIIHSFTNNGVATIRISSFEESTARQLLSLLKAHENDSRRTTNAYILDLRDNGGGAVIAANLIADMFLSDGEIMSFQDNMGEINNVFNADNAVKGDIINGKSLVVLVNNKSASAAEMLAGILQLNNRAVVIGIPTFGKGSVQNIYEIGFNLLAVTNSIYLIAGKYTVQNQGVIPNLIVTETNFGQLNSIDDDIIYERDYSHSLQVMLPFLPMPERFENCMPAGLSDDAYMDCALSHLQLR